MRPHSLSASFVLATIAITSIPARSQQPAPALAFEVVSIRQIPANAPHAPRSSTNPDTEITADGWRLNDSQMFILVLSAFQPSTGGTPFYAPGQVQGLPKWTMDQRYQIDARVSDADRAQWQNPSTQAATIRAMLQSMLADRCKLAVHRESKEEEVYSLVVAKNGPKFKQSDASAQHPHGPAIPGGGEFLPNDGTGLMHFYDAPASAIAGVLSNIAGRPVVDDTGLTGRYDLALQRPHMGTPSAGVSATDDGATIFSVVGDLGLKLVPAKRPTETLVIDHIEPPSAN